MGEINVLSMLNVLYGLATVVVAPLIFLEFGGMGILYMFVLQCATHLVDYYVSEAFQGNISVLNLNGIPTKKIVPLVMFNCVFSNVNHYIVIVWFAPALLEQVHFDIGLVSIVFVQLVCAEVMFTLAHTAMHRCKSLAPFHVLHHCCLTPSWSTNLLFHPVDLALEFSGPVAITVLNHILFFQDDFAMAVTFFILISWYALDHDENLKLYHYSHHKYIDSVYSIYVNLKLGRPELDQVKPLVKRVKSKQ